MTDTHNDDSSNDHTAGEIKLFSQYIKDFSFESPMTPALFRNPIAAPDVEMNIGLASTQQDENIHEVVLKSTVHARDKNNQTVFLLDITYGGLVSLRNIPEEMVGAVLYIEVARLLFPFVRRMIGDTVREGSFPSLVPDMPDFAMLYKKRLEQIAQEKAAAQQNAAA